MARATLLKSAVPKAEPALALALRDSASAAFVNINYPIIKGI